MEPVLSPYKEKGGPPPCTAGIEHYFLHLSDNRPLDNKNIEVKNSCAATGIIVTPVATGKKPADVILYIEPFNSRFWNNNGIQAWRMDLGDITYGLGA